MENSVTKELQDEIQRRLRIYDILVKRRLAVMQALTDASIVNNQLRQIEALQTMQELKDAGF